MLFLGVYSQRTLARVHMETCVRIYTGVQFTVGKICKQPICLSVGGWLNKQAYVCCGIRGST